ncbi:MAG TPA: pilus assembly protein TadG-related protein, partial [Candidatus Limnocylindrales bacterium]|nr:pilus assembly protein TadG-related protein [Candidatus Limnocylindrales bacterium]
MMPIERQPERGQVLPLFALFLVVLLAFAALAIDVSGAYSARRFYRSVADGASLAGAQDLQLAGSRLVGATERIAARRDAMKHVTSELGIVGSLPATCSTSTDADIIDNNSATDCVLPGTTFHVSIKAGSAAIACVECDPLRSVQVGLRNAKYHLSFASVLGQASWSVGISSVAGLQWSKSYAVVTLRPRASLGQSNFDVKDIKLDGAGTRVTVSNGDVASNANMVYTGGSGSLSVDPGFGMYFADPAGVPTWAAPPTGAHLTTYVAD